jgi:hypothetical protein
MRAYSCLFACAIFAVVAASSRAQAATFDISDDFSLATNPTGVWSFGFTTTLGGALTLYDVTSNPPDGSQRWTHSVVNAAGAPSDFNNPNAFPIITCATCAPLPGNTAAFHPGQGGENSVFRFTNPTNALYNISVTFTAIDDGPTDVYVMRNNGVIFSLPLLTEGSVITHLINLLALAPGETIDFAVGTRGNFLFDSVAIDATITSVNPNAVPLPPAVALFATGFGMIGLLGWRRKKKQRA